MENIRFDAILWVTECVRSVVDFREREIEREDAIGRMTTISQGKLSLKLQFGFEGT